MLINWINQKTNAILHSKIYLSTKWVGVAITFHMQTKDKIKVTFKLQCKKKSIKIQFANKHMQL